MRLASLTLALAAVWCPQVSAQTAWGAVTSKEGQFTVEMPVKPTIESTKARKGPGGTVKMVIVGCETASGLYIARKIEFPTAIVKGTEEKELDEERDYMAKEWNGKVISEKKVLAINKVGRDFTIRGEPEKGSGILTIRVREYFFEKSMYVVLVVSAPNRELPADTGKFLGSLAIGTGKTRAAGKVEPEPTGTELAGWGLAIDPDKDCKITPAGKSLALDIPAAMHDFGGPLLKFNAPRIMREVDGDFAITVKVVGDFKPGPKSTNPKGVPYLAAGILIWSDSENFIRLERASMLKANKIIPHVAFLEQEGGYSGAVHNVGFKDGPCYLRLERKGSRVFGYISSDGTTWNALKPIDTIWPSKLKVGLQAISTSSEPFSVRFEEFTRKPEK